jgi:hypothetical protein
VGGAAIAMVAVAKRPAVVVEKRITGTVRYNTGEDEDADWDDLQKVKRVVCREAAKSIFSKRLSLKKTGLPMPTRSSRRMCLAVMSEGGL